MLKYGCTRLEIGVQSVYEDVARDTNRYIFHHEFIYFYWYQCTITSGVELFDKYLKIM